MVQADQDTARRIEANLYKQVNVLYVEHVAGDDQLVRELLLVKVRADQATRGDVLKLCDVFRAHVVDLNPRSVTIESTGAPDKIDGLLEVLRPFGIVEMVRTGALAMSRGSEAKARLSTEPEVGADGGDDSGHTLRLRSG